MTKAQYMKKYTKTQLIELLIKNYNSRTKSEQQLADNYQDILASMQERLDRQQERIEKLMKENDEQHQRTLYFEQRSSEAAKSSNYYRDELEKAHTLIGRITQQFSECWDSVNLSKYFPTDNMWHKRTMANPDGK